MGKRVDIHTNTAAYWRSLGGEQSPQDLECAFQLIYRLFTTQIQPREEDLVTCMRCVLESWSHEAADLSVLALRPYISPSSSRSSRVCEHWQAWAGMYLTSQHTLPGFQSIQLDHSDISGILIGDFPICRPRPSEAGPGHSHGIIFARYPCPT